MFDNILVCDVFPKLQLECVATTVYRTLVNLNAFLCQHADTISIHLLMAMPMRGLARCNLSSAKQRHT